MLPVALVATIGVMALACLGVLPSAWGVNHLGYLPRGVGLLMVGLAAASMLPFARSITRHPLAYLYERMLGPQRSTAQTYAVALGFTALCVLFASATQLWGDGELWATLAEEAASSDKSILEGVRLAVSQDPLAPGAATLHALVGRAGSSLGLEVRTAIAVFQAILGGLWVLVTLRLLAALDLRESTKVLLAVLLYGSGAVVLFFGYIEDYTAQYLIASILALLGLKHCSRQVSLVLIVVLMVAAFVIHILSALLLPAVLYMALVRGENARRRAAWVARLVIVATLAAALALWLIEGLGGHLRPIAGHRRAVLSTTYALSLANLLALFVPAILVLIAAPFIARSATARSSSDRAALRSRFLWTAVTPFIIYLVFFMPDLGMTRDWDLYAVATPFLIIAFVPALDAAAGTIRRWLLPIAVVSLVQTGTWVAVNANEGRSLARYQETLLRDPAHVGYAYEILANYYVERGRKEDALQAWRAAHAAFGNPRYAFNAAMLAAEFGRLDEAIELTRRGLAADPANTKARINLATYLATVGNAPALIEVSREGLRYEPDNSSLNMFLGMALFQTRQYAEAREQLGRCLELDLTPEMRADVVRALEALGRLGEDEGQAE